MQRMLIALAGVIVLASPALSQNWSRWDDRDSSDHEDRGRSKRDYPRWHDMDDHHGSGRGARFMVRSGDSVVAVRCDGSGPCVPVWMRRWCFWSVCAPHRREQALRQARAAPRLRLGKSRLAVQTKPQVWRAET